MSQEPNWLVYALLGIYLLFYVCTILYYRSEVRSVRAKWQSSVEQIDKQLHRSYDRVAQLVDENQELKFENIRLRYEVDGKDADNLE